MAASPTVGSEGLSFSDWPLPGNSLWSQRTKHLLGSSMNCNPLPSVQHHIMCLFGHVHSFQPLCLFLLAMVVFKHVHFSEHQLWIFQVSTSKQVGRTLASLLDPCGPCLDVKFCISKSLCSSYGSCVPSSLIRHPQNPAAEVLPRVLLGHVCGFSQVFGGVISFFSRQC